MRQQIFDCYDSVLLQHLKWSRSIQAGPVVLNTWSQVIKLDGSYNSWSSGMEHDEASGSRDPAAKKTGGPIKRNGPQVGGPPQINLIQKQRFAGQRYSRRILSSSPFLQSYPCKNWKPLCREPQPLRHQITTPIPSQSWTHSYHHKTTRS